MHTTVHVYMPLWMCVTKQGTSQTICLMVDAYSLMVESYSLMVDSYSLMVESCSLMVESYSLMVPLVWACACLNVYDQYICT